MNYDMVMEKLKNSGTLKCSEFTYYLEILGFYIRNGKSPNHKICIHPNLSEITDFKTASFCCKHGRDGEVKKNYIKDIVKILKKYEPELKTFEKEQK